MIWYQTLEHGSGLPLVLLHGMMGSPENWGGVFVHLPRTCRAVALKIPFFQDGVELNSVSALMDYAQGYLAQAGIDEAVFCGNSLGGHVSLKLALARPDLVRGLVLTGSSGLFERTFGMVSPHPSREWVREKIAEIFHDKALADDELVDHVVEVISVRRNVRDIVKIAKSAKRDNLADSLKDVRCPVLLIWGEYDEITPPDVAEEFHEYLPDSELVWLAECGHAAMMEHPRQFADAIEDWWDRRICPQGVAETGEAVT